jgi:hypothetical protein
LEGGKDGEEGFCFRHIFAYAEGTLTLPPSQAAILEKT